MYDAKFTAVNWLMETQTFFLFPLLLKKGSHAIVVEL